MILNADRCLRRSALVEELFEAWEIDHQEAMLVRDAEELVEECIDLCGLLGSSWNMIRAEFFATGFGDFQKTSRVFQKAVERSLRVVGRVSALGAEMIGKGFSIRRQEELCRELGSIRTIQREARELWATNDGQLARSSIEDYAKGEYCLITEIADAL